MAFSLREAFRHFTGGDRKPEPLFKTEKEAYDYCRSVYESTNGATPDLRRAYEFYLKNYNDGSEPDPRPPSDQNYQSAA